MQSQKRLRELHMRWVCIEEWKCNECALFNVKWVRVFEPFNRALEMQKEYHIL